MWQCCKQHLQGHWQVIQSKRDLDVILRATMCACSLHNLLLEYPVTQDWLDSNDLELDEDDECR